MAVYLLHFSALISEDHTTQHYIGYAKNLEKRLEKHRKGTGSRLCEVALERGISWEVARVWPDGDRKLEKKLKALKNARARLCPICKAERKKQ